MCESCISKLDGFLKFKQMLLNILMRWQYANNPTYIIKNIYYISDCAVEFNNQNTAIQDNVHNEIKISDENDDNSVNFDADKHHTEFLDDAQLVECESKNNEPLQSAISSCNNEYECNLVDRSNECHNCNNFYASFKNLQAHQKYCFKQKPEFKNQNINEKTNPIIPRGRKSLRTFVCEVCEEKFNKVKLIIDHYITIHSYSSQNIKPYACDRCVQKFSTLSLLLQHLKYHDKDRSKMCPTCGKSFITSNDLMSHQYIHLNRRNYKCKECNKAFNTNKNLRTHILVVHTDRSAWKYHCEVCDKRFPQKSNFDQHSRRHTGDKQHVCHICQKPFISSSELKRHIQLHSNIKLFKCIPCGTEYKTQRSYKQHVDRKHSDGEKKVNTIKNEKIFVCHICPSHFSDKPKLVRHLSRHSGLKPYDCSLCEKKFSLKAYLRQHLKVIHGQSQN